MRKTQTPYTVQVDLSAGNPVIGEVICNCKAGLGRCAHVIGLLYTLAPYQRLGLKSVPPGQSLTPKPINLVEINKIKPQQNDLAPATKVRSEGVVSNLYCPVSLPLPCKDFAERLQRNHNEIGSTCQLASLMNSQMYEPQYIPSPYGDIPLGSVLSYHIQPVVTPSHNYSPFALPL
ncbi:hypothetical protein AALO_G00223080 [Alosa alosa]|uniref:SWIM-type domain-containing protein n=1 Tax=Alosa alosa TaxID=278164 RepID=A0AAV6G272_9TELE|nr:hypothetical protein AALO_G00223080 [Alosa alosa]